MSEKIDMLAGWSGFVLLRSGKAYYATCIQGDQDRPGCINVTGHRGPIADVIRDGTNFWSQFSTEGKELMAQHDIVKFSPDSMPEGEDYSDRVKRWEDGSCSMIIERDTLVFSSGRRVTVNRGIIGLSRDLEVFEGYDDVFDCGVPFNPEERRELAAAMIERWQQFCDAA